MCAIVGIASSVVIENRDWLAVGRDAMYHRGPDDQGEWWSDDHRVGLAHRRLSIIDLSPAGHQPMLDASGTLAITFNGEIYNYRELQAQLRDKGHVFSSRSDTEVILAAYREWGVDCLAKFNGMFAFVLYDCAIQKIFMARDRAGEKPLFYGHRNGELRFASELKGLLADRSVHRLVDHEALDLYLAMGFVPGERCIIQGLNKLPPAHALTFDLTSGEKKIWPYWRLPAAPARNANCDAEELLREFEALLEDAVGRQLVADVPVGVLLSGGVDSSLLTAMAVRASDRVKTFTVGFPGAGEYDERGHARLIANHFNTEHIELNAEKMSPDILFDLARQFDEPMLDSSMVPTYAVSQLVRRHCTVALGGDGGDELFGGYGHYNRLLWTQEKFAWLPQVLKSVIGGLAGVVLPMGFKGRNWLQALSSDLEHGLPLIASYFDRSPRRQLMSNAGVTPWPLVAEAVRASRIPQADDLLQRATRMEFENYLAEDILVKVDRASMLNSLEMRAPLLDYRIVEFAFGKVPSSLKATSNSRKILLKMLAAKLLPREFDLKRKQGFSIPLSTWLRAGPWRDLFNAILLDRDCLFDRKIVNSLFANLEKGRNTQERLFALVMFELWRREYKISL